MFWEKGNERPISFSMAAIAEISIEQGLVQPVPRHMV